MAWFLLKRYSLQNYSRGFMRKKCEDPNLVQFGHLYTLQSGTDIQAENIPQGTGCLPAFRSWDHRGTSTWSHGETQRGSPWGARTKLNVVNRWTIKQ